MFEQSYVPRRFYFVRHGQPDFPEKKHYVYGHTDYALSSLGETQAQRVGEALSHIPFDAIFSSDLKRAHHTATFIARGNKHPGGDVRLSSDFREIYMGDWEGREVADIGEAFNDLFYERTQNMRHARAPGGESFQELQERAQTAFSRICEETSLHKNILVVAHGGFFWALSCMLFDLPIERLFGFRHDYCGVHLVEEWEGQFTLVSYNWNPSLCLS